MLEEDSWELPDSYWCIDTRNNTLFCVDPSTKLWINNAVERAQESGHRFIGFTDIFGASCEVWTADVTATWYETPETRFRTGMHSRMRQDDFDRGKEAWEERPNWK